MLNRSTGVERRWEGNLMQARHFEEFAKTPAGRRAAGLLKACAITPKQLLYTVFFETVFALPYLMEGEKYTTEQFCGPEKWSPLRKAERRVAGMCLAYLVKVGAIPLTLHRTRNGEGTKRYQLPVKAGVAPLAPTLRTFSPMTVAQ